MTSRTVESRLPVIWWPTLRVVASALLMTLLVFPLPVDRTDAATIAGSLTRRAIIGQYRLDAFFRAAQRNCW